MVVNTNEDSSAVFINILGYLVPVDYSIFNQQESSGSKTNKINRDNIESMVSFNKECRDNRFTIEQKPSYNHWDNRNSNRRSREDRIREMSKSNSSGSWVSLSRQKLREDEKKMFTSLANNQGLNEKAYNTLKNSWRQNYDTSMKNSYEKKSKNSLLKVTKINWRYNNYTSPPLENNDTNAITIDNNNQKSPLIVIINL